MGLRNTHVRESPRASVRRTSPPGPARHHAASWGPALDRQTDRMSPSATDLQGDHQNARKTTRAGVSTPMPAGVAPSSQPQSTPTASSAQPTQPAQADPSNLSTAMPKLFSPSSWVCADPDPDVFLAHTLKTLITSSPRWLMTLTAMRPEAGSRRAGRYRY